EYVLSELGETEHTFSDLSTEDLQRLFSAIGQDAPPVPVAGNQNNTLATLIDRLERKTTAPEKTVVLDRSAAALAQLNTELLAKLVTSLPDATISASLLEKTVKKLEPHRLESLLLQITNNMQQAGADNTVLDQTLNKIAITEEVERTKDRIYVARSLIDLEENPTPPDLLPTLQQPDRAAPVLVTAMRQIASRPEERGKFTPLLNRYEKELEPTVYNQVARKAGSRVATLDEEELGRILVQRFKGIFGKQLYSTVITQLSDEKFEKIAEALNLIAQRKLDTPLAALDQKELEDAYQRLMQTVRGEKLRAILALHQNYTNQQQKISQEQIRENIRLLLDGELRVLTDDLFLQTLPSNIKKLIKKGKFEAVDLLLTKMVTGLRTDDMAIRRGSAEALGRATSVLVQTEQWSRLDKLIPALVQALPFMEDLQAAFQALNALEKLTRHHIIEREYNRAVNALDPLFDLTVYADDRTANLAKQAQNCLDRLADASLLDPLLENIQAKNSDHESSQYLISRMGAGAANFLLSRLGKSEIREERELLLKLIEEIGKPARNALLLLLEQDAPWYITRNIIRLFRRIGDPDCFTTLAPYIHHEDIRVQREVVQTLGLIGGLSRKQFFLQELPRASLELQPLIVRQLGKVHDEGVVLPLTDLLAASAGPPHHEKEQLQTEICIALARLRSKKAIPGLKKVVETKNIPGLNDYAPSVIAAAESALHALEGEESILEENDQDTMQAQLLRKHDPLAEREAAIFRKAARGKTEEAKQELYDLVIECAKNKDFANAERLRERIYEIDPMALTEIIRTGEFIEKEKTGSISPNQLETWSELLELLDPTEFSAIYHELEERSYEAEEIIVHQGDKNDELFFINQGTIKISYNKDGREIFVSTLLRGQIIGENFFDASFWTVTLTALTPVNVSVLKSDSFHRWQEAYPGLEGKLQSFYNKCNTTCQLLRKKGLDRRQYERIQLSRKINIQLLDNRERPIGRKFRGELADISKGGLSYLIRISKKENTRLLLGRTMQVTIPISAEPGHIVITGLAIGVQPYDLLASDFSVHLRFPEPLDQKTMQRILG
ncbi:MAG: cyclic nucleotide-binding domain-containing protein, partial [Thermodesulfobacteria bacterium]|nr:cyclic nucleotide-binding domain-containing protein [Thermodesulfobacteriota bacterium]